MIRKRIIQELWDDVERKAEEKPRDFRPRDELSQDKSERGLGEIAADDMAALARKNMGDGSSAADDKLKQEHAECSKMLTSIFQSLDALSNWHYTPRPIKDTEISAKHTAALDMEEQTPLATSAAQATAPQEIYTKSTHDGAPVAATETTQQERQAARRRNKSSKKKDQAQRTESKKAKDKAIDASRTARGLTVDDTLRGGSKGKKKADAVAAQQQLKSSKGNRGGGMVRQGNTGDATRYGTSSEAFARIAEAEKRHQARPKVSASAKAAGIVSGSGDAGDGKKKDGRARNLKL
jgi:U3 small nucleolar RNA-associated protein MPP10